MSRRRSSLSLTAHHCNRQLRISLSYFSILFFFLLFFCVIIRNKVSRSTSYFSVRLASAGFWTKEMVINLALIYLVRRTHVHANPINIWSDNQADEWRRRDIGVNCLGCEIDVSKLSRCGPWKGHRLMDRRFAQFSWEQFVIVLLSCRYAANIIYLTQELRFYMSIIVVGFFLRMMS